ncbi:uncharacterized protein LOC131938235 [Physella acuta]|uniref:uncharacterized protein LOC131938235 n=1 Tax=Physella acuta TaxID=109671 RepID=UPI0027DACDA7|nr:uncharacterized protein LOC131938235 [Physella acuta]
MKLVFFLLCLPMALSAQDCTASLSIVNKPLNVSSAQECFESCASDPKCTAYRFADTCINAVSNDVPADTDTENITGTVTVFVHCRSTQQCKAKASAIEEISSVNNTECFRNCSSNPRCYGYRYSIGNCIYALASGDDIDISTSTSTAIVCCSCDDPISTTAAFTTTTLTTSPITTTITKITTTASTTSTTSTRAPATTQADTTTNEPATTTRLVTTVNNQQTTNSATRNNPEPTPTTRAPAQRYYDCHSCTSGCSSKKQNYLCPANGKIKTGTNTRFVRCKGPCMSTVNKTPFGGDVVRGCSDGKFPGLRIPANGCLTHKKEVTCFCTGDRCNTRNMVQEQRRMGYGWWMWRGQHYKK